MVTEMRIQCGTIVAAATMLVMPAAMLAGEGFTRWVDPFIGSVGSGNTFPGACRPFGLVQASPDVKKLTPSGYKADCDEFVGFSNTHLSGTGNPACGAKASAGVGRTHSSDEAGQRLRSEGVLRAKGNVSIKWGQAA